MFTRIAVACFALYCVHGGQNTARDGAALAEKGASLVREAGAEAPKAALSFCLENQALCAKAVGAGSPAQVTTAQVTTAHATTAHVTTAHVSSAAPTKAAALQPVENYPLPPRRPAAHKKA